MQQGVPICVSDTQRTLLLLNFYSEGTVNIMKSELKMTTLNHENSQRGSITPGVKSFSAGLFMGLTLMLIAVILLMPGQMILSMESKFDFDTTLTKIQDAARREKWSIMGTVDFQKKLSDKGFDLAEKVTSIQICKGEYAHPILQKHKWVATLMPCSIAVWQDGNGKVFISKMNTGLMGKLFGGIIAEIMGGKVTADEAKFLNGIIAD